MLEKNCPCHSGKPYMKCCRKYHEGVLPENALALMRSRYAAYALGLAEYLIQTTHSKSPYVQKDKKQWLKQIIQFSQEVSFDDLKILETEQQGAESYVSFVAYLSSKEGKDMTFSERSRFLQEGNAWKYIDGEVVKGAVTKEQLKKL